MEIAKTALLELPLELDQTILLDARVRPYETKVVVEAAHSSVNLVKARLSCKAWLIEDLKGHIHTFKLRIIWIEQVIKLAGLSFSDREDVANEGRPTLGNLEHNSVNGSGLEDLAKVQNESCGL